ncbi:hypothetical protein ACGFIV_31305 [Sphaerisporangium sp. NPDC049003]|uniref:hypothetical protein n=1 Tax=Sphaerisporangium sp. NPDC049003 TaxID=3364517 RepID=UPI0037205D2F
MEDGAGFLSEPAARRLPMPVRQRRPALAGLAVLLILGGALATTLLVVRSGNRVAAIRLSQQIGAGQPLSLAAMEEVQLADTGIDYLPWSQREHYAQYFAPVSLLPGTVLTESMAIASSPELGAGTARVGLALKPGQFPSDLKAGYRVQVIHAPVQGSSEGRYRVLAPSARIDSVEAPTAGGPSGMVTVIVDSTVSPAVAAYASVGEIVLAELPAAR